MRPLTDFCKHVAVFYDKHGKSIGTKTIKYRDRAFTYKKRKFNFLPQESFFKIKHLTHSVKYYHYDLENPNPLVIKTNMHPVISSRAYNDVIENDYIKKLNDLSKPDLLGFLKDPKMLLICLVAGGILYYYLTGGFTTV